MIREAGLDKLTLSRIRELMETEHMTRTEAQAWVEAFEPHLPLRATAKLKARRAVLARQALRTHVGAA